MKSIITVLILSIVIGEGSAHGAGKAPTQGGGGQSSSAQASAPTQDEIKGILKAALAVGSVVASAPPGTSMVAPGAVDAFFTVFEPGYQCSNQFHTLCENQQQNFQNAFGSDRNFWLRCKGGYGLVKDGVAGTTAVVGTAVVDGGKAALSGVCGCVCAVGELFGL